MGFTDGLSFFSNDTGCLEMVAWMYTMNVLKRMLVII